MNIIDILVLVVLVLALAALVARLAVLVRGDGYGHRPPPPSQRAWSASSALPR